MWHEEEKGEDAVKRERISLARSRPRILLGAAVILGLSLMAPACGYRFQGATPPQDATIEIPVLENKTVETGIETILTDFLISEMRKAPGWKVVEPGQGRYILKGSIVKFVSEPHAISPQHLAVEHRATLVVDISLRERGTGKELWRDRKLTSFADYPVGPDILASERAKREAISKVAKEFASRVRVRVQDTW